MEYCFIGDAADGASDVDSKTGVELNPGTIVYNNDFVVAQTGSISGTVQGDSSASVLSAVTIRLKAPTEAVVRTTSTIGTTTYVEYFFSLYVYFCD